MNILTTFLLILLILLILYSITIKKCGYCLSNMNYYEQVLPPIKKSTPDVIFLDTPKDKSYNKFCKICKKMSKKFWTGACDSCNTFPEILFY